jgi:transcription elongation factor GreA
MVNQDLKEYLSKERHAELVSELQNLKTIRRKEIAQDLEYARSLGDLSENAEFNKAREDQAIVEDRINQIESVLANAEIVKIHHNSSTAEVGTTVVLLKKGATKEETFMLVGSEEIDYTQNKLSLKSPIGVAMSGKNKGDEIKVKLPTGKEEFYTIKDIK